MTSHVKRVARGEALSPLSHWIIFSKTGNIFSKIGSPFGVGIRSVAGQNLGLLDKSSARAWNYCNGPSYSLQLFPIILQANRVMVGGLGRVLRST